MKQVNRWKISNGECAIAAYYLYIDLNCGKVPGEQSRKGHSNQVKARGLNRRLPLSAWSDLGGGMFVTWISTHSFTD